MAQSALTVTTPNPTPPTNFACTGVTGPNPPNFTRQTYNDPKNWSATNPKDFPPPYYDDGTAAAGTAFIANVAALASGTSAADNNTGTTPGTNGVGAGGTGFNSVVGTYPGTGTAPFNAGMVGTVPASTSVAAEGAGTEVVMTKSAGTATDYGVDPTKYGPAVFVPVALVTVGSGPAQTAATIVAGPNGSHASSLSPATNPTLTTIAPTTSVHATAAITMTATGTGFTRQSRIYIGGVAQATTYVSATSLTCLATPPLTAVGNVPVTVVSGGVVTTTAQQWNIT
jgi:hypothetical protein